VEVNISEYLNYLIALSKQKFCLQVS